MKQAHELINDQTIMKTLMAAKLFDGFWDRWKAHGVDQHELARIRSSFSSKEGWMVGWKGLAEGRAMKAEEWLRHGEGENAELELRLSSLYYQLMQWLIPGRDEEKTKWLNASVEIFKKADLLSPVETRHDSIELGSIICLGRVCVPLDPKGIVIMINPFDSTKEELYTYEMDFIKYGFTVMNFDGPGQGQTFSLHGKKATTKLWQQYTDFLIEYAKTKFPELDIYLFGTSSGAAWTLYGSCSPYVKKAVAVSPAFVNDEIQLPDYFIERTRYLVEEGDLLLPPVEELAFRNPVLLVHGKKDVMVPSQSIYDLYGRLPNGKKLLEYENEGHCCNYQLPEIRKQSVRWFQL